MTDNPQNPSRKSSQWAQTMRMPSGVQGLSAASSRGPEYQPTIEDLSRQIGALSQHITVLHRECALMHAETKEQSEEVKALRREVSDIRTYVMLDQSSRLTRVEAKASRLSPSAKAGGIGAGAGGAIVLLIEVLWPLISGWIH